MTIAGIDRAGTVGRATPASGGIVTYRAAGFFDYLAEGERATDSFRYELNPGKWCHQFRDRARHRHRRQRRPGCGGR